MFTKDFNHQNNSPRLRFCLSSLISLSLAAIILWGLLSISSPTATLYTFNINKINTNYSSLYIEMEVNNQNHFRGFNYTKGWVDIFYITNDSSSELTWQYIPHEYQGFGKSLHWNFTLNLSSSDFDWDTESKRLNKNETHLYISLFMGYLYKILSWKTETTYYQWLEAKIYLDDQIALNNSTSFNRMKNFTLAIST